MASVIMILDNESSYVHVYFKHNLISVKHNVNMYNYAYRYNLYMYKMRLTESGKCSRSNGTNNDFLVGDKTTDTIVNSFLRVVFTLKITF